MSQNGHATTDDSSDNQPTMTVNADSIIRCLKMNDTIGVDDRIIRVFQPYNGNVGTDVRREFRGSERYSNPEAAPAHVPPRNFLPEVERSAFATPPRRHECTGWIDVPELSEDRDEEDEERLDEAYEEALNVWENDVQRMLVDELTLIDRDGNEVTISVEYTTDDE
jgi:hypothetical protein